MIRAPQFVPGYWPVYAIAAASVCGALSFSSDAARHFVFAGQWSPQYLVLSPFVHAGAAHLFLNVLGLHFIGGQMLLPFLGAWRFLFLFAATAAAGTIGNNIFGGGPAAGISAAVLGMLSCALHRFARTPMRLLLIHDLLRLRPFPLWTVAAFVVFLDVAGIVFGWRFFAHWAHLAGFAAGGIAGFFLFGASPPFRRRPKSPRRTVH
ncbi:MAG: rhomboid family intramembrane serine protease [Gammaproteobacteria bacterium]